MGTKNKNAWKHGGVRTKSRGRSSPVRQIKARVQVQRTGARGPSAFHACVIVGSGPRWVKVDGRRSPQIRGDCAYGKNPRKAIANAMTSMARKFSRTKGAFAGVR